MSVTSTLSRRAGAKPRTTPATPHRQLDQNAPPELQEELWQRMAALADVKTGGSVISMRGTRALHLDPARAAGPAPAFVPGSTEFAHLHPRDDGSVHLTLPEKEAAELIEKGWAEVHPVVRMGMFPPTLVMVFGPRDGAELEIVWQLVQRSYDYARGVMDAV